MPTAMLTIILAASSSLSQFDPDGHDRGPHQQRVGSVGIAEGYGGLYDYGAPLGHGALHVQFGPMPQSCYGPRYGCYPANQRYTHRHPAFHGWFYRKPNNYRNFFDYPWHAGSHEPTSFYSKDAQDAGKDEMRGAKRIWDEGRYVQHRDQQEVLPPTVKRHSNRKGLRSVQGRQTSFVPVKHNPQASRIHGDEKSNQNLTDPVSDKDRSARDDDVEEILPSATKRQPHRHGVITTQVRRIFVRPGKRKQQVNRGHRSGAAKRRLTWHR